MAEGPFEHGDHEAVVRDRPTKEAHEEGFVPAGIVYGGDLIACAGCRLCGRKVASSIISITPVSEARQKEDRLENAVSIFRAKTLPSCDEERRHLLASDVMES